MLRMPGMKGLRTILTMERGLRRATEASIPPKEDEADLVPTNAWGLIIAAQVAGIKEKSLTRSGAG